MPRRRRTLKHPALSTETYGGGRPQHVVPPQLLAEHRTAPASLAEWQALTTALQQQQSELHQANELLRARNDELVHAQEALRRSEAEARLVGLVASRTQNGVVITDATGGVVWINQGFTRITGYSLDDIAGRKPGHLLQGPGTDPATVAYMRHQLGLQRGFTTEILNYARNGRPYWVAIEVQPVRTENGHLTHYLAIETDITHRREAEEALRAETEVHTTTLASILDGVIAVSPEALVQILNPAAEALTGWPVALAQGRPLREVLRLTCEDGSPAPDLFAEAVARRTDVGNIHRLDRRFLLHSPTRTPRRIVASARPMLRDGQTLVGGLIVFRDVTAELEVDEMKRDFVYAVSHELRTPLTSLCGFLSTILSDPAMPAETREEFTRIARDQAQRLSHLVNDILEISRIEPRQIPEEPEPVDLEQVTRSCLAEIAPLAERRKLALRAHLEPGLPPVQGNPDRVRSILNNLLGNAVKFTPHGGHIAVSLTRAASLIELVVQDSGIGIPADQLGRIFQKFYRVRRPGMQIAGTGLGLAIVQGAVQGLGGRIEVDSQVDRGTRFRILLPLPAATSPPAP